MSSTVAAVDAVEDYGEDAGNGEGCEECGLEDEFLFAAIGAPAHAGQEVEAFSFGVAVAR